MVTMVMSLLLWGWIIMSGVKGHGRLLEPPSRASMWRLGFPNPRNYDDNQLFCGGLSTQHEIHNGRCGVCGDAYSESGDGDHVAGGTFANGIIGRTYKSGQVIDVIAEITANHLGWMEFHICPNNDPKKKATESCMRPLIPVGSTSGSIIPVTAQMVGPLYVKLQLPDDLQCVQCVLRWRYIAGNSWGVDKATGNACQGCGNQENFYACADVTVGDEVPWWDSVLGLNPVTTTPTPTAPAWNQIAVNQWQQPAIQPDYSNNQVEAKAWSDNNNVADWGADNYKKYAHLYYTQAEVVTLPTTTRVTKTDSNEEKDIDDKSFDPAKISTAATTTLSVKDLTTTTVAPPPTSKAPVWKTLNDFNLGDSLLSGRKLVNKTVEKVTLRPVPKMGSFNFSSLTGGSGTTPAPSITIKVAPTTPKPIVRRKPPKKSLIHSVIKGDLSWAELVRMMHQEKTTAMPVTPALLLSTTTPAFTTTTASSRAQPLEVDIFHREQLVSVLNRGQGSGDSIPYVSSVMRTSKSGSASSTQFGVAEEELVDEAGEDLLDENCTVLVIGEESGQPTYLAVCDDDSKK